VSTNVTPAALEVLDDVLVVNDLVEDVDGAPLSRRTWSTTSTAMLTPAQKPRGIGEEDFHWGVGFHGR
jgi:hypothetical protein